jgi:sugar lactone lactonase YvrE
VTQPTRVGDISLTWGESLRWDDRRQRLYFVDAGPQVLHWLDEGDEQLRTMAMPSIPTGVALTEDGRLVVALDDGLHLVDPDSEKEELLAPYPDGIGARANDANADLDGNLVTGTLNLMPGEGSYWWWSSSEGWRKLDDGIGNANGPVVLDGDGRQTLVFADTQASVLYAYDYDGAAGTVGERRRFGDTSQLGGIPDGACADADGGVWGCVLGPGILARWTSDGLDQTIETGAEQPSDVTFGGPDLDRMYYVSIALDIGIVDVKSPDAGALMMVEGTGFRGRPEPRVRL